MTRCAATIPSTTSNDRDCCPRPAMRNSHLCTIHNAQLKKLKARNTRALKAPTRYYIRKRRRYNQRPVVVGILFATADAAWEYLHLTWNIQMMTPDFVSASIESTRYAE